MDEKSAEADDEKIVRRLRSLKNLHRGDTIKAEFDVEYHPDYLSTFLRKLGLSYSIPRSKRPSRPEYAEEVLDEPEDGRPHNNRERDDADGWTLLHRWGHHAGLCRCVTPATRRRLTPPVVRR